MSYVQATATQDVAGEIRRRNDLYGQHVHHQRHHTSSYFYEFDIWAMLVELNIQDEQVMDKCNAMSFYMKIQYELNNYLGCHMSFGRQSCLHL